MSLRNILIVAALSISLIINGCIKTNAPLEEKKLAGFWMSGGIEIDPGVYQSTAIVYHFDQNGKYRTIDKNFPDSIYNYKISSDSIVLRDGKGLIGHFQIRNNILTFGNRYKNQWIKLSASKNELSKDQILDNLQQNFWTSDFESLNFKSDTAIINNLRNKTKTQCCYELLEFDGLFFIYKKGNRYNCNPPHGFLEYIFEMDEEKFSVLTWDEGEFKHKEYKRAFDFKDYPFRDFEKCNPLLYRNNPSHRYYFKYTSFPGGTYALNKLFSEQYDCVDGGANTGLVRVGFVVNCVGKIGEFEVLEFDENYRVIRMNKDIRNQIVQIMKDAGDWIPGERWDQPWDNFKYVNFKIKDGDIEEIFY